MQFAQSLHAVEEAFYPVAACRLHEHRCRQREGEEGGKRSRAHCGKIAQTAREAAMAYGFGGMEAAAEVAALECKVGGDKHFAACGRAEDGAVIADAERDSFAGRGEGAANLFDQT